MRFRKWANKRTGAIHIVQFGDVWIALCRKKLGDGEIDLTEWKPTYITIGACQVCLKKWRRLK